MQLNAEHCKVPMKQNIKSVALLHKNYGLIRPERIKTSIVLLIVADSVVRTQHTVSSIDNGSQ